MALDRGLAQIARRRVPSLPVPFDGDPRLALITVNFSTTRWLTLMLLTLSEQDGLGLLHDLVVVDNGSRDGGRPLLRDLAERVPKLQLVERERWLHHGPAMRAGVRALDRADTVGDRPANVLLFCDPDVIFLRSDALQAVAECFGHLGAALAGEVRHSGGPGPDIQASLFAVRRDVHARRDVYPLVHDGSPAHRHQGSIHAAGLTVIDLPTNRSGLVLHRGRTAVAAAGEFHSHHPYATALMQEPHYMGVPDGEATWASVERRYERLLRPEHAGELVDTLAERLGGS